MHEAGQSMTIIETKEHSWECGCPSEHRPATGRAWCFECYEWCYPHQLCREGIVKQVALELHEATITCQELAGRLQRLWETLQFLAY